MGRHEIRTGMADAERQLLHGDPEIMEKKRPDKIALCVYCIVGILMTVMVTGLTLTTIFQLDAHYYVTIDSVSPGHDPTRGLSFNLALGVASRSYGAMACIKPGNVEVYYHGVQLAVSEAESGELCVKPGKPAGKSVAARVTGVPVGQVMDSLAADMKKQGVALFDVVLHLPDGSYGAASPYRDGKWVSECGDMPVGAAVAWCDAPLQPNK